MSKFFALLVVLSSIIFSAESALAGDWRGGGGHHGWSYPHSGGHYSNHYGHHGGKNDFLYGVLTGMVGGVILGQPQSPVYSQPPPVYAPPPQRCWTEWRRLYDRHGRQFRQMITVCEHW